MAMHFTGWPSRRGTAAGWTMLFGLAVGLGACAPAAAAATKPAVMVGAYYFDGWNHKNSHVSKKLATRFAYRKPIWGWYDNTEAIMREQINLAADHDIAFWAFDWYCKTVANNQALHLYLKTPNRSRLGFCLNIINSQAIQKEWTGCVRRWVFYLRQPTYLRLGGKPLLIVFAPRKLIQSLGGVAAARSAFGRLRAQARKAGIPGIQIAANAADDATPADVQRFVRAGFTLLTGYGYFPPGVFWKVRRTKPEPFSVLAAYNRKIFDRFAGAPLPYIPSVNIGLDPRADDMYPPRPFIWFTRTPRDVERAVRMGVRWIYHYHYGHYGPAERILLLCAWNETDGWLTPTAIRGDAYLDAVKRAVATPPNVMVGGGPSLYGRAGAQPPPDAPNGKRN